MIEYNENNLCKNETILSLDLGTKTGWAIRDFEGNFNSGSQNFSITRFEGGGMRFRKFINWLEEISSKYLIDLIVYEKVMGHARRSVDSPHIYGGFLAILTDFCESKNIPYTGVHVKTIKKWITGNGNALKKDIIESVKLLGFSPGDDNEADALALLNYSINNAI